MKRALISFCLLLLYVVSTAQQTEFYAGLNAGVLSFRGKSAVNSSFIIQTNVGTGNYTNNLYSRKAGIGIGVDIGLQRITKGKIIYGIVTGMELLKHRVPVTHVSGTTGNAPAKGEINIHSHFINIRPATGYRFSLNNKITLDLAASLEIAVGLSNLYEVGLATIIGSGDVIEVENDRNEIITDLRPGLQVKANVKRYSLLLGYWMGQS
ncbi:MAG: hypothetical protein LH619_10575, partial [Chitinophagaceae bacterium]|nr:hypothetical protein [Chitinophagaceae bacterium]